MIRLKRQPTEPEWIELLPGVELLCGPVTSVEQSMARAFADRRLRELDTGRDAAAAAGGQLSGVPDVQDADKVAALRALYQAQGLARAVVTEWRGVVDEDLQPLAVTPEGLDEFIRLPHMQALFTQVVMLRGMAMLYVEGEASGTGPDTTSPGAPNTAPGAVTPIPPAAGESGESTDTAAPT